MKWNIGWGCVSTCNMKCAFCYSKNNRIASEDLNYDTWKRFIDKNASKIETINYGTGENSLSDDWFRLICYIREKYPSIRQALTTNGHIFEAVSKDKKKEEIFFSSIDEVDVSLDFADRESHNTFRGQPRAYDWAINTLELCSKNEIPVTIVMLGSQKTLLKDNVDGIFRIARQFDAVVRVNIYRPTNGIDEMSSEFILKTETLLEFLRHIKNNYVTLSLSDALLSPIFTGRASKDPSGMNSLRILPNGNITPSTYLISEEFVLGNISEGVDIDSLGNNSILVNDMKNIIPKECVNCRYVEMCEGGVKDRRYLWKGGLEERDPYCFVNNEQLTLEYNFEINVENTNFSSVHDGYLPTMFFKNKN